MKMVIHVKVVKSNEKDEKLRLTFDMWTTSFGMIRNMLAHEYNISRTAFKIRNNEKDFKNNSETNNRPAMSIPIVYGDGCWLEMKIKDDCIREAQNKRSLIRSTVDSITRKVAPKEKTPFSCFDAYENSSAFSDESSDFEVGPKEESCDSEEFSMI